MRRILIALMLAILTLSACGGTGDTTVTPPPQATPAETTGNTQIDAVINEWRTAAPARMKADAVKPETIEEHVYTSAASLSDVKKHYDSLTSNGWVPVSTLNNSTASGVIVLGYDNGNTSLVVGAIDMENFGGTGTTIYTLKGSK